MPQVRSTAADQKLSLGREIAGVRDNLTETRRELKLLDGRLGKAEGELVRQASDQQAAEFKLAGLVTKASSDAAIEASKIRLKIDQVR